MSASLNTTPFNYDLQRCTKGLCQNPSVQCLERPSKSITIGLVNNMSDGALEATERQFLSLLNSASDGLSIQLSLYSLPNIPRNEFGASHVIRHYSSVEDLWNTQLDGLIVTGREPLTPNLEDEAYWKSFTKVLDWARENTYSTIWSCLAAHAATQYLDGISRIRNGNKRCGVFECARLSDHPLIADTPSSFMLPHSRWNGLPEDELMRCGYRVLTRSADAGVDTFIKHCRSMFVFFQGHPEYEYNTLLLEYRRDVTRYLKGETNVHPLIPRGYFDSDTVAALTVLQEEAISSRREDLVIELSGILENINIESTWHATAVRIFGNWLRYICAQKKRRSAGKATVETQGVDALMPQL